MTVDGVAFSVLMTLALVGPVWSQSNQEPSHTTEVRYRYYEVDGNTADVLLGEMLTRGPVRDGRTYFGLTEALTGLNFETLQDNGYCRLVNIAVRTEVVVTLPTWTSEAGAPSDLVARWKVFETALQNHEGWHVASSKAATREIHEALESIRAPDCLIASNQAKQISQAILDRNEIENWEYDRTTGHGKTQGAVWPPQ